ncbi:MAG: toxin-antitoxin system HicB family antitoxin [Chitinivibrionales bacterium]|nr:toxin-antitoxin system HicB family antitoxin [Chitinivibrionales bacterium]MBD3395774.1 toxin-antitoxin system HicB family antitoxin [Chitinivibrionales bacterium]
MSNVSLRLPHSLHQRAKLLAKQDGVSVNQFITIALSEELSVMDAMQYVEQRAKRASRERFDRVLNKVPDRKPLDFDRKK